MRWDNFLFGKQFHVDLLVYFKEIFTEIFWQHSSDIAYFVLLCQRQNSLYFQFNFVYLLFFFFLIHLLLFFYLFFLQVLACIQATSFNHSCYLFLVLGFLFPFHFTVLSGDTVWWNMNLLIFGLKGDFLSYNRN